MNLKAFFVDLSDHDREQFAVLAGTTVGYLNAHVLPRRKIPRPALMEGLVKAVRHFDASATRDQVVQYFYEPAPSESGAAA